MHLGQFHDRVPGWYDVMLIAWFAWTGLMLGVVSLRLMQEIVSRAAGAVAGWVMVALVTAPVSYTHLVVAANAWADEPCYATLLPGADSASGSADSASAAALTAGAQRRGGCSAFIATGSATTDGRPVMGHDTWTDYDGAFVNDVMFYVHPLKGYDFTYQSSGGEI